MNNRPGQVSVGFLNHMFFRNESLIRAAALLGGLPSIMGLPVFPEILRIMMICSGNSEDVLPGADLLTISSKKGITLFPYSGRLVIPVYDKK